MHFLPQLLFPIFYPKFWPSVEQDNSDFFFLWHLVGWSLLGFPEFSTCWQMFIRCPIIKDLVMDVLVRQVLKGLQSLHFALWLVRYTLHRPGFSSSFSQAVLGMMSIYDRIYQQSGMDGVFKRVYQTMPFLPLD